MSKRTPGRILATLSVMSLAFAFVACATPASESEKGESTQNEAVLSQEEVDEKYRQPGEAGRARRDSPQTPSYNPGGFEGVTGVGAP
jgi:hypothetical protein